MRRIKELLTFKRPKGPGFGISRGYYLSVLTGSAMMPSVVEVVNPKGENGAMAGFGVPLSAGADKSVLERPMERGVYAMASLDRKTVLKTMVLSKEEAGFDPDVYVRILGAGSDPELLARVRSTWQLVQMTFESFDPEVWPAVDFLLGAARLVAERTDGVVADPVSRVYKLPQDVRSPRVAGEAFSVWDVVWPQFAAGERGVHVYTLGLQKFGMAELEFPVVEADLQDTAGRFLMSVAAEMLKGGGIAVGDTIGHSTAAFVVAEGGLDRRVWDGLSCYEIIPDKGDLASALRRWEAGL